MKLFIFILVVIGAFLLTNCSPKDSSLMTSGTEATFTSIYNNVLSKNCAQCHEPNGSATVNSSTEIDFSNKTDAYQTLINGKVRGYSVNLNSQCNTVPLIKSGQPEQSYMLATLFTEYHHEDFYVSGCTPYSPSNHAATMGASEKEALIKWIQNGALNN